MTAFNEPGIAWAMEPWDLYQSILGAPNAPFLSTFMVDARIQATKRIDPTKVIADAQRQIAKAPDGKVSVMDGAAKLFADGAIISQLIHMRDPFLDEHGEPNPHHHGEWIMEPEELERYFQVYWDAGWQVHTHVNGDAGLDVVLDIIERCQIRFPRADHRSVLVHFGTSNEDQVSRIARLGAIVSSNPYYPCAFVDKFSQVGLGPARADVMARNRSVVDAHVSLSLHSDLPMAPSSPLKLASFAVNRRTQSGCIAGPEQRLTVDQALRAVTIDAAYSWHRELDLGSITPGKFATFTVLGVDPYLVDPEDHGPIVVRGVVFQGDWVPVPDVAAGVGGVSASNDPMITPLGLAGRVGHIDAGCSCDIAQHLAAAFRDLSRRAA